MSVSTISRSKKSNLLYIKCPSARQLSKENIEFALPQDWILESEIGLDPDADYSSSENRKILSSKAITNNTLNKGKTSRKAAPSNSLKKVQKKKRSSCSPLSSRENIEVNGRSKPSLLDSKRLASSKKNIYPIKYDGPKYKYIEKNVYVNVPTPRVHSDEDLPHCDCGNSRRDCSDDDCINRMLMVCCPPSCPATPTCRNSFPHEDGPIEPFKTKNRGWGLRAKRNIAANQFVTEYRGQIINSAECDKRRRKNLERGIWDTYLLGLESDLYIDARFMSGLGRFLNHSCEPNTIAQKWQDGPHPRIAVFAKRDIRKGEEITLDYSFSDPRNQFRHECLCGSKMCRGYIDSDKPIDWEAEDIRKSLAYDHCFECGEQGDLLTCGFSHRGFNCHRAFHIQCLGLTLKPPPKTWFMCPSHTCDICNKVSPHVQCLSCVSAWCQRHCPFPISLNTTNKLTSQSQQLNVVYRVCPRCLTDNTHTHLSSFYFGPLLKVTESPDSGQVQEFSLHCTPVMESDQNDSCSDDQSDVATDDINEDHTNLE